MSLISRQDFIKKVNSALNEGKKLLVGKEEGKGGGGRPVVELKDEKFEWYIDTLKKDATQRFGNVEGIIQRDATGKVITLDSSLFDKVIATSTAVVPSSLNKQVSTVIEVSPKKGPGRPPKSASADTNNAAKAIKIVKSVAAETSEKVATEASVEAPRRRGRPAGKANNKVVAPVEAVVAPIAVSAPITSATQLLGNIEFETITLAFNIINEMNKNSWKKLAIQSIIQAK